MTRTKSDYTTIRLRKSDKELLDQLCDITGQSILGALSVAIMEAFVRAKMLRGDWGEKTREAAEMEQKDLEIHRKEVGEKIRGFVLDTKA